MAEKLTLPRFQVRPGERVCCAISGGADSTALLLLLDAANKLPKNALGVGLSAVHVHHRLRGAEADQDQAFVENLCARLAIPLILEIADVERRVAETRETLEEAARELRLGLFRSLIADGRANVVATAHTLDDQAETVLMKLLRGAWTEGLAGIAPVFEVPAGRIVRPLLRTRRDDLREFLRERDQPWREDSSNTDEGFTRNRLRHSVLPALRAENPALDQTLANLAEMARDEESFWTGEVAKLLPGLVLPGKPVRGGGRANSTQAGEQALAIEVERLRALAPALRRRLVRAAARQLGARLSFSETERILALAGFPGPIVDPSVPTRPGSSLQLTQNLLAERSVRELRLSRRTDGSALTLSSQQGPVSAR